MTPILLVLGFVSAASALGYWLGKGNAPKPEPKPIKTTADAAARLIHAYYLDGGRDNNRIAAYQLHMGKIAADGIVGSATKDRYQKLTGLPWDAKKPAPRPLPKPAPKPAPKPGPKPAPATDSKIAAARLLRAYYDDGGRETNKIKAYQLHMEKLTVDGKVGSKTRARYTQLTGAPWSNIPSPPKEKGPIEALFSKISKPAAPKPAAPKPAAPKPAAPKPAAPKPAAKKALMPLDGPLLLPPQSESEEAAAALDSYVRKGGSARSEIAVYQRHMKAVDPDGIAGPATKARAQSLLGKSVSWPTLTPLGAAPSPVDAKDAANELADYVTTYHGSHVDRIAAYQKALGLGADGKVGPVTRAKVKSLTGRTI